MLNVGDQAPDFKLFSSDKAVVSLSDYRGKNVVVLFFPMAFTGVCTTELCTMRDSIGLYTDLNAEILAISVDSVFSLDVFKKQEAYNFPLLSDFNKEVSAAYSSLFETFVMDMRGVSKRAAFVVDTNGIIQYAEVLGTAGELPNFEAINATLASLN